MENICILSILPRLSTISSTLGLEKAALITSKSASREKTKQKIIKGTV